MKQIYFYYLLFIILFSNSLSAQTSNGIIYIATYTQNVCCDHTCKGTAKVVVSPATFPPYVFQWSNGQTISGVDSCEITGLEKGLYTVTITDSQDADLKTYTFDIEENFCAMVAASTFTPNGDGINDTWFIQDAQFFPDARILVFNRLGQKVYDHEGLYNIPWDAKDLVGAPLPDAAYYYVIYQDKSDKSTIVKGCVSIVR